MTSAKLQSSALCQYKGIKQQAQRQVQALQLDRQSLRIDEGLSYNSLLMREQQTHPHEWLERDLLKWGMQGQYSRIGATAQYASRQTKLHSYLKKFLLNSCFILSTTLKEGMCLWHKVNRPAHTLVMGEGTAQGAWKEVKLQDKARNRNKWQKYMPISTSK